MTIVSFVKYLFSYNGKFVQFVMNIPEVPCFIISNFLMSKYLREIYLENTFLVKVCKLKSCDLCHLELFD
jgi:hypothetical protein